VSTVTDKRKVFSVNENFQAIRQMEKWKKEICCASGIWSRKF